ncbi:MAG: ABC transporter family substrate-binding protein [Acidimicrobiales bacterium]
MKSLALLFTLFLFAAACGGDDDDDGAGTQEETTTTAEEAVGEAGGSVVLAGEQIPTGLVTANGDHNAAWTADVMQQVWPQVVTFLPDGTYEVNEEFVEVELTNEDPQTVEYRINEEAVWSDGTPITAADFVFTWESQSGIDHPTEVDPESGEPVDLYNAAGTTGYDVQTCEEGDDEKHVVCEYSEPYADWYALFAPVLPVHAFEAEGDGDTVAAFNDGFVYPDINLDNVPSGGPYVISEIDGESSVTLARNESYWGTPGLLDEILVRWITDGTQHPAALENREIDVTWAQAQIDLVQQTQALSGVTTDVTFGTFYEHIDFNFTNAHLAKREVRQAIAKALDRAAIVERIPAQMAPDSEVLNSHFFYPGGAAYVPNGEEEYGAQDLDAAAALLEGAGYTLGGDGVYTHPTDGPLAVRFVWRDPNPRREQTAQLVQAQLADAGIQINLSPAPDFGFLDSGDYDIAMFGWTNITVPSGKTDIYSTGGGSNYGSYSNPDADDLFAEADVDLDPDSRSDTLNRIDEILWQDVPVIPLFQVPEFTANRDTVENVQFNGYEGNSWNMNTWALVV